MHFQIRTAVLDDEVAVGTLLHQSYSQLMRTAYPAEALEVAVRIISQPNRELLNSQTYFVAEKADGKLIGCGGWTAGAPGSGIITPGFADIRHFATHPDAVRQGVGRAIVSKCVEGARAAGLTRLQAYSTLNGEPFYARLGLNRIGPIHVPVGNGLSLASILMEGPLP